MRTLMSAPPTSRVGRYPRHTFGVASPAHAAVPFMIAPVLPGETLENLFMEARVVSAPVKNPLIGWKQEYYFFYVRVTDLLSDVIRDMFVDPTNTDLAATLGVGATSNMFYTAKGGVDYAFRAYKRIVEEYFRDEGEAWNVATSTYQGETLSMVQVREIGWLDSATDKDDMPVGPDPGAVSNAADLEALMQAFEQLRALGIANMTYEDFLRSYGIAIPNKDENKPELLCRFTDFQYPSNTIDPTNGDPTSALSWVFKNGSKERKFFKEPGFLIGISVTRPKLYFGGLSGNLAAHLTRAWDWLPNYLWAQENQAMTSLKKFSSAAGPLGDRSTGDDAYWVDMRDLFLHGDQWHNGFQREDGVNPIADGGLNALSSPAPTTLGLRKYPTQSEIAAFFVDGEAINADGYVSLNIKGHQVDYTQANIAAA